MLQWWWWWWWWWWWSSSSLLLLVASWLILSSWLLSLVSLLLSLYYTIIIMISSSIPSITGNLTWFLIHLTRFFSGHDSKSRLHWGSLLCWGGELRISGWNMNHGSTTGAGGFTWGSIPVAPQPLSLRRSISRPRRGQWIGHDWTIGWGALVTSSKPGFFLLGLIFQWF